VGGVDKNFSDVHTVIQVIIRIDFIALGSVHCSFKFACRLKIFLSTQNTFAQLSSKDHSQDHSEKQREQQTKDHTSHNTRNDRNRIV